MMRVISGIPGVCGFAMIAMAMMLPAAPAMAQSRAEAPAGQVAIMTDREAILAILSRGPVGIESEFSAWERNFHPDWTVWFSGQDGVRARDPHMANVRAYVATGAAVIGYEFELDDLVLDAETALVRFHAVETIRESDGGLRIVPYAGTDYLVRRDGRWLIRTSSVSLLVSAIDSES